MQKFLILQFYKQFPHYSLTAIITIFFINMGRTVDKELKDEVIYSYILSLLSRETKLLESQHKITKHILFIHI